MARSVLGVSSSFRRLADQPNRQPLHGHHHGGRVEHGRREHPSSHSEGNVNHALRKSDLSW